MTKDARAEASEGCCSADFATPSLCWQWNSLSPQIATPTYHSTPRLKKKMQFSAIFYHFALISSHILIGSHRQKNTAHKKSEEAALPHSIFFHGTKPTPYTSSPEDLPSVLRDARQIGSAVSVFAKHFDAITMARSFCHQRLAVNVEPIKGFAFYCSIAHAIVHLAIVAFYAS